jgi:hypothetical protein
MLDTMLVRACLCIGGVIVLGLAQTAAWAGDTAVQEAAPGGPVSWSRQPPPLPRPNVLRLALKAYECGRFQGYFEKSILSVIDYSLPSSERRLWVIDVESHNVLFHEFVAHGRNSGDRLAYAFSNELGSLQSSLGLFRAGEPYYGRHGYSLSLVGLEAGVNDRALERRIVIHGADYVRPEVVSATGRLGRSWGCPALDPRVNADVIDLIKGGSALFVYYPDRAWLSRSPFLNCHATEAAVLRTPQPSEPDKPLHAR